MLGAILGLAGTAASGLMSYLNNKKAERAAEAEAARREAYYQGKANENPLARSENQHLLGQYDRAAQQQIENARGVAAITGATPEFSLGVQKGVAQGRADLMGHMASDASRRSDFYNERAEQARHDKAVQEQERIAARNETFANLAANAANVVGNSFDSYLGGKSSAAPVVGDGSQTTSESISSAPSRAAAIRKGANAATSVVDKQVLADTANAAENVQKMKTATPPAPQTVDSSGVRLTPQYVSNGDGTYTMNGEKYYKNFDGSYTKVS